MSESSLRSAYSHLATVHFSAVCAMHCGGYIFKSSFALWEDLKCTIRNLTITTSPFALSINLNILTIKH